METGKFCIHKESQNRKKWKSEKEKGKLILKFKRF